MTEPNETNEKKGAAVRFPPPFVPLIALALGMVLHWFVPLSTPIARGAPRFVIGGGLVVLGVALMAMAFGWFRKTGQDPAPWEESPELIVEGVYRWTRNPMYLSMGMLQAGLGILFASVWPLILVPATWSVIYQIAIRHEETYLSQKFGESYERYRTDVRRWI
jgi:protein-S-isoprenylcysteine O-methyltransferase Ste14